MRVTFPRPNRARLTHEALRGRESRLNGAVTGSRVRSRFVVDTMLGRLARWLRAMGYDTLYLGQAEDRQLLQLARAQARILLTRDRVLARLAEPHSCLIRGERVDDQILEAVQR